MKWPAPSGTEMAVPLPDATAFEQAVLPHLDAAYNLARRLMRDSAAAEDVVQDSVIRALSYFATYRGGDGRAWLLRIVRNVAYGALTTTQRRATDRLDQGDRDDDGPALQIADPGKSPEATLGHKEDLTQLDRALGALPIELRECLVLRELEELSYREIGHVIGVPIGTVMSRLWRARQSLALALRDQTMKGDRA